MKSVQHFSDDYIERCRQMTIGQKLQFLDDFRKLQAAKPMRSKLISMKVPEDLLATFKAQAAMEGVPYQTQIKKLMRAWLVRRNEH